LEARRPAQLSGGQQQRAALARILVGNPSLLLLDEPFSSVDSFLREQLQTETQKLLRRFGKDTFLVTHNRDEAYRLCDDVAVFDTGKIVIHKETKQLFADPESRRAAILTGCKNVAAAKKSGEYEVEVIDWGVRFITSVPVREGLCAIGIRARHWKPHAAQNSYPVRITDKNESPFEFDFGFRYDKQSEGTDDIRWYLSKDKNTERAPEAIGLEPENIMLLYG
jgi:molybdate transport system ATP-binding protein